MPVAWRQPTRVTELGRGGRVLREEERLDARHARRVLLDHGHETRLDEDEALSEREALFRGDDAMRDVHET